MWARKVYGYRRNLSPTFDEVWDLYAYHKGGNRQQWYGITQVQRDRLLKHLNHNGYACECREA